MSSIQEHALTLSLAGAVAAQVLGIEIPSRAQEAVENHMTAEGIEW